MSDKEFSHLVIDRNFDDEVVRKFKNKKEADWFILEKVGLEVVKNPLFKAEPKQKQHSEYEMGLEDCGPCLF